MTTVEKMMDLLFNSTAVTEIDFKRFLLSLAVSLILGMLVSLCYIKTQKTASQSLAITLVMLPAVLTTIIMLVGTNVASAFSLAGAFSIIRFRSAAGDAKDITYILFSLAFGLASGLGFILYAVLIAVILSGVMLILEAVKFGASNTTGKILKITIPEDLDYQNAFDDLIKKYTTDNRLNKVKTTDLGSLYELEYSVTTKNSLSEKEFIDELRCRNGNLNITLILSPKESEF